PPAAASPGPAGPRAHWRAPPTSLPASVLPALPSPAGRLPAPALAGDRRDRRPVRAVAADVPLRAAAVLPGLDPAGADGRHRTGRGRVAALHRGPGEEAGSAAADARGHPQLRGLRRYRFAALLPAAGPAAAGDQLQPVRGARARHPGARGTAQLAAARGGAAVPRVADARDPAGERPAGGLPGAVPRLRRAHRPGARDRAQGGGEG